MMPEITDPSEEYFKDGTWGWDGTQWQKQPLLFGYAGVIGETLADYDIDAGTFALIGETVPSGEVWIITQVSLRYDGTVPTRIRCNAAGPLGEPYPLTQWEPGSQRWYNANCFVLLEAGDHMQGAVDDATAGNEFRFRYSGYKITVA